MTKVILIKLGEVWLKGGNRDNFIDRLVLNIQNQTGIKKQDIQVERGRIYISENPKSEIRNPKIKHGLKRVFGVHSFVEANKIELDYDALKQKAVDLLKEKIGEGEFTFRVSTSRAYKDFEKNSEEIAREVGAVLLDNFPKQLSVDLEEYDINLIIEVRREGIYVYFEDEEIAGPGGLPVGMSGRGLMMLSGGIDSPVASWLLMKRGMEVDAVYFHSPPYTGDKTKEKIIDICKALSEWRGGEVTLYVPHFTKIQTESTKEIPKEFWTLLHRRFMVKISEEIAREKGYQALGSGENLGQVASQTIENMAAVAHGAEFEILRPLLGFDKQEIIDTAKHIGTYDISILPFEDCCTVFSAEHPRTKSTAEEINKLENKFNADSLVKEAIDKMEMFKISKDNIENVIG